MTAQDMQAEEALILDAKRRAFFKVNVEGTPSLVHEMFIFAK
jgi:hypothetical protein